MRSVEEAGDGDGRATWEPALTPREFEVCLRFGIQPDRSSQAVTWPAEVQLGRGTVVLVTGPSGSGKSRLLASLAATCPMTRCVHRLEFPTDVSVLDGVAPGRPLIEAVSFLTVCSLGEPRLWLRRFDELSEGEQFRARLARAISLQRCAPGGPLLCDEFGSSLHRRTARAIAFNLRKLVSREGLVVVTASAHEDLEADLEPDVVIRLSWGGEMRICRPKASPRARGCRAGGEARRPSFAASFRIERGSMRDYALLAELHYRQRDQIGCVDSVFVLRDGVGGEVLGVVVYGHSPLELSLRNEVTDGRFIKDAARLNREVRILRRLIVHPDVRGCGLGRWLVAQTLPMVGTKYVECLSAMGLVNPVFEKAGMRRVGLCAGTMGQKRLVRELAAIGIDPLSADFVRQACSQPRVRRMVTRAVFDWYRAGTAGASARVARQGPAALARAFRQLVGSQPVYYLWSREECLKGMMSSEF
jgi:ABC-type lipoprotein export system ATPase subunit